MTHDWRVLAYGGFFEMPAPAPDLGGRPVSLHRIARQAVRADGTKWLESLKRDAAMGDAGAIRVLLDLALQAPSKQPPA